MTAEELPEDMDYDWRATQNARDAADGHPKHFPAVPPATAGATSTSSLLNHTEEGEAQATEEIRG